MPQERRILVVEHNRELGRLYQATLEDEGFEVDLLVAPADLLSSVREGLPALLVLDLPPPAEDALALLDSLRTDEVACEVPVVALTTQDALADEAISSYNVRQTFAKPFDLDDFVRAVAEHSAQRSMLASVPHPRPSTGTAQDAAEHLLAERSRHIVFRWVQRIRGLPPWRDRPDLTLEDLIDHAPGVLGLIDVRLHYVTDDEFFRRHPDALERARGHALARKAQNIGVVSAVEEYVLLREELWREIAEQYPRGGELEGAYQVERAINRTLDTVIVATLRAYLEQVAG